MSRSLHTQKLEQRAARRLARPYSIRSAEAGLLAPGGANASIMDTPRRIPIHTQRPLPGLHHPLHPRDIRRLFETLGPAALYGVRAIRQKCESAITPAGILFGEYVIPGIILLYAVPASPWRIPYLLHEADVNCFVRYGCLCSADPERETTILTCTPSGLRDYFLCEVLAHELGHHQLQYHKGKRRAQICRTGDHEKRADLQTRRIVRRLPQDGSER